MTIRNGKMENGKLGNYITQRYLTAVAHLWFQDAPNKMGHYWSPSTDIAAAWQVVEKFTDNFQMDNFGAEDGKVWRVFIVSNDSGDYVKGQADTAPLAICRAALKACRPT